MAHENKESPLKYELLLLLMSMIWGSAFVAQQIGMEKGLGPMTFNALRFALGCLVLVPVMLWGETPPPTDRGQTPARKVRSARSCPRAGTNP